MKKWIFVKRTLVVAPTPWSPLNIASLRAWYDADDGGTLFDAASGGSVVTNNTGVGRWEDKSGGGYHITQGTSDKRPVYKTSQLNGKAVVEFDGSNDELKAATASDWNFLHDATGSSVFLVARTTNTNSSNGMSLLFTSAFSSGQKGYALFQYNNQRPYVAIAGSGNFYNVLNSGSNNSLVGNTTYVIGSIGDPSNGTAANRSSLRMNGGTAQQNNTQTGEHSTATAHQPLVVGGNGPANPFGMVWLNGYIAEIVICNAIVSTENRQEVEGYLAHKWGLQGELPGDHPYKNEPPPPT